MFCTIFQHKTAELLRTFTQYLIKIHNKHLKNLKCEICLNKVGGFWNWHQIQWKLQIVNCAELSTNATNLKMDKYYLIYWVNILGMTSILHLKMPIITITYYSIMHAASFGFFAVSQNGFVNASNCHLQFRTFSE